MMKHEIHPIFLLLLNMLSFCLPAYAAESAPFKIVQNGRVCDSEYIFSKGEITFIPVEDWRDVKWEVAVLSQNDTYIKVPFHETSEGACVFNPLDLKDVLTDMDALKIYDPELDRDLYELNVVFTNNGKTSSIDIRLALLPCRPKIGNVIFKYEYNPEWDALIPNSDFSFDITSEGATTFIMYIFYPKYEHYAPYCMAFYGQDKMRLNYEADWEEYISVSAGNEFGYVRSDTIFTTDYITDETILRRIEELRKPAGNISSVADKEDVTVSIDNNNISFSSAAEMVRILNISGRCIFERTSAEILDISGLAKGIYVMSYKGRNSKIHNFKFIKK